MSKTRDGDDVTLKHVADFLRMWANFVKDRDGRKCTKCGTQRRLHAHHIKPKSLFPNLMFEMSNGITLCKQCHMKEHKFMTVKKNTRKNRNRVSKIKKVLHR